MTTPLYNLSTLNCFKNMQSVIILVDIKIEMSIPDWEEAVYLNIVFAFN